MRSIFVTVFLFFFASVTLQAHPHVFIETDLTVCFNDDMIDKLLVCFEFDEMFSADFIQNFDANKNAIFEPDEIEQIKNKAFANLINYNYFIHVIDGGKTVKIDSISDFTASMGENGKLKYFFTVNTNLSTSNPNKVIKIATFDHTYFIDVELNKNGVKFINNDVVNYSWKLIEDKSMAYYYEQIYPTAIVINFN